MQNNLFMVCKKTGNGGNQFYSHRIKNENEEMCKDVQWW